MRPEKVSHVDGCNGSVSAAILKFQFLKAASSGRPASASGRSVRPFWSLTLWSSTSKR